jgi:hypothetical protein
MRMAQSSRALHRLDQPFSTSGGGSHCSMSGS